MLGSKGVIGTYGSSRVHLSSSALWNHSNEFRSLLLNVSWPNCWIWRQMNGLMRALANLPYTLELRNPRRPHSFDASEGSSLLSANALFISLSHSAALSGLSCHLDASCPMWTCRPKSVIVSPTSVLEGSNFHHPSSASTTYWNADACHAALGPSPPWKEGVTQKQSSA